MSEMSEKRTICEQATHLNVAIGGAMHELFEKNAYAAVRVMASATLESLHLAEMLGKFDRWVQNSRQLGEAIEDAIIPDELLELLGDEPSRTGGETVLLCDEPSNLNTGRAR